MEVRCRPLSLEELEVEVGHIYQYLVAEKIDKLEIAYGWTCNLDIDELYTPRTIYTTDLLTFVADSRGNGVFKLGDSDMHINSLDGGVRFDLCHESDIHFEGSKERQNNFSLVGRAWDTNRMSLRKKRTELTERGGAPDRQ